MDARMWLPLSISLSLSEHIRHLLSLAAPLGRDPQELVPIPLDLTVVVPRPLLPLLHFLHAILPICHSVTNSCLFYNLHDKSTAAKAIARTTPEALS